MPARFDVRHSFAAGEVTEDQLARPDLASHFEMCARMRNAYPTTAGRARRRPGSSEKLQRQGAVRTFMYRLSTSYELIVFQDQVARVYSAAGALLYTLSSAPWLDAHLDAMTVTSDDGVVYVAHQSFWTQALQRSSTGVWTLGDLEFDSTAGGGLRQPYYRFADKGVTMYVDGYTGSGRSVQFSGAVLTADHVGKIFRYGERVQVQITGVTNSSTGTGTVLGRIFPAVQVTVGDTSKFAVGEIVQGEILQGRGVVAQIISSTVLEIQMIDSFDTFKVITASGVDKDRVIGPRGSEEVTALTNNAAPRSISLWDEAMFSDVRGYPGAAVVHKSRLLLSRFPQAKQLVVGSAINAPDDFLVPADTVAATDPFAVAVGGAGAQDVLHLVSTEQLIVCTNQGVYYVPESGDNPLTPESLLRGGFNLIAPVSATNCPPVVTPFGVVFIQDNPARLMLLAPTGNVRASWQALDLSFRASHLLSAPVRLAVADGFSGRETLILVVNDDGTIAAASPRAGDEPPGFALWSTRAGGLFVDACSAARTTILVTRRGTVRHVSELTDAARVDDERAFTAAVLDRNGTNQQVVKDKAVIGTVVLDSSGDSDEIAPAAGLTIGWDFAVDVTPSPPRIASVMTQYQRIAHVQCDAKAGNYRIGGVTQASPQLGDDIGLPTPTRRRVDEQDLLGWSETPGVSIGQEIGDGSELEIYSLRMTVES